MAGGKLKPGQMVVGRWRVLTALERDAHQSYRVRDEHGNDAELLLLPSCNELQGQAETRGTLRHENIIALFEAGDWRGETYLIRELVTGQSVRDWLLRDRHLGYDQALGIACQLCLAPTEAARGGIPFLGLEPGNVLVNLDGFAKVDPLRLIAREDNSYQSPEERRGEEPDQRSDLFRIGLMIHEMLSGGLPERDRFGRTRFEPLTGKDLSLPHALDAALSTALADSPADRFRDAESFLDELHPLLMRRPLPASAGPTMWYEDRRFWLYVAIALGALALVLSLLTGIVPIPF